MATPDPTDILTQIGTHGGSGGVGGLIAYLIAYFKGVKPLEEKMQKLEERIEANTTDDSKRDTAIALLKQQHEQHDKQHQELKSMIEGLATKIDTLLMRGLKVLVLAAMLSCTAQHQTIHESDAYRITSDGEIVIEYKSNTKEN